jgi:uncharacterized protein YjdB
VRGVALGATTIRVTSVPTSELGSATAYVAITVRDTERKTPVIRATSVVVNLGETSAPMVVTATGASGASMSYSYSSENESIFTVDSSGRVHGVGVGSAYVIVESAPTANLNAARTKAKVTVRRAAVRITVDEIPTMAIGQVVSLNAKGVASTGDEVPLTYTTSNARVATVSSDGKVTAVGRGTVTITVRCTMTDTVSSATRTMRVQVE